MAIADAGTNVFTDVGVTEGNTYYYALYVSNDLGEFTKSNVRTAHTADVPPIAVVLNPVTSLTTTSLTLTWSQNNDTDFKEYRVYRAEAPGVTDLLQNEVAIISDRFNPSFDDTGLNTTSKTYYYRVYVVDKAGNRTRSNEVVADDGVSIVQSASFAPTSPVLPNATLHFTLTLAGNELGQASEA